MRNKYLLLIVILFVGLVLRLVLLSSRPLGFTWDEAALGYNAYSLLKTGRDEYGQIMPLVFKSFGDYKPGLYVYASVLPIKLFGLSIFSTRLVSAIFGSISVILIYLLTRKLYPKSAFASTFLLAISPWAIHFSRGAWEANFALFLTLLAVTLFYYKKYPLSIIFLGLTFYTYQSAKLFTPLLLIGMLIITRTSLLKSLLIFFLTSLFTIPLLIGFSGQSGRLNVYNVFNYTRTQETINNILRQDKLSSPNLVWNIYHAEIVDQGRGVIQRYLNHLSPDFLFISGDWSNSRHAIPYMGYFYYPAVILLIIGFVYSIKHWSSWFAFVFYWLIVSILPSAFSRDIISGVRSLPLVVPLTIISGIGTISLIRHFKTAVLVFVLFVCFFIYFLDLYFVHLPKLFKDPWLSAYEPLIKLVSQNQDQYSDIYFTDKLGQPYIFVLFFNKIDPEIYQKTAFLTENINGDVGKVTQYGKYHFGPLYWPTMRSYPSSLFIGDIYELPEKDLNQVNLVDYGQVDNFKIVGLP